MAEYVLSAILTARDRFTSVIRKAQQETQKLESTVGQLQKDQNLKINVEGLPKIERLKSAAESARSAVNSPLRVNLRDDASSRLGKIKSELDALTKKPREILVNIKTNGAEKLKAAKESISNGISGAAMAGGAAFLGMGAAAGAGYGVMNAVQSQMDFEKSLSNVKALLVSGRSDEELTRVMTKLTAKAEELGASTKFTAAEVAEGMKYQALAGWTPEQITAGIKPLTGLASAGDLDLKTTSDILTDAMTAFGLKAGEVVTVNGKAVESAKHFGDLMAATFTNSNTDIQMMGEAAKYAAPVIQSLYANATSADKMLAAQDTFLVTGLMANAGVKASQAGTSMRSMITRLAASNRNAYFSENALGIKVTDENGEARRLLDIVKDFRTAFKEGVDMDKVTAAFEQFSGEKIHADTRRKLDEYYENVQKSGGKMTGMDKAKMASMLAGQEAMSGWLATFLASDEDFEKIQKALENCEGLTEKIAGIQMDNLSGSVVKMTSAWDAFQRSFVKGEASSGLRSFVDSVTDSLSRANVLFADGIDFSDLVKLGSDAVSKLKNKFLELDGIGSLLAGGALFMGLKKLLQLGLKVKDTLSDLTKIRTAADLGQQLRGNSNVGNLPPKQLESVGTMNVRAGVVNLSGNIKGFGKAEGLRGQRISGTSTNQQRVNDYYSRRQQVLATQNQSRVDDYYNRRQQVLATQSQSNSSVSRFSGLRGAGSGIGASVGISALFGLMDVASARSNSEYNSAMAREELAEAQAQLKMLQENNAGVEQIQAQMTQIQKLRQNAANIEEVNAQNERRAGAGAAGAMLGTAAGAALGSIVPVVGTMMGAMLGGMFGQFAGEKFADIFPSLKSKKAEPSVNEVVNGYNSAVTRRAQADEVERTKNEKRQQLLSAGYSESELDYSSATTRRARADIEERAAITKEKQDAEVRSQTIQRAKVENTKRFGYSSLAQDYSVDNSAEVRKNTTGQEYVNLNKNALTLESAGKKISSTIDSLKERFSGGKDFTQPSIQQGTTPMVGIQQMPAPSLDNLSTGFDSAKTSITEFGSSLSAGFETAKTSITEFGSNLSEGFETAKTSITEFGSSLSEGFESAKTSITEFGSSLSTGFDSAKTSITEFGSNLSAGFESAKTSITEFGSNLSAGFESAKTSITEFGSNLSEGFETAKTSITEFGSSLSEGFESAKTSITEFGSVIDETFSSSFESASQAVSSVFEEITGVLSSSFEALQMTAMSFGESISTGLISSFESISVAVASTFAGLSATISGGVESARAVITTTFQSAAAEVQGVWGAIPGFFSGIFGSLGGIAAGAGSAIAAGINSGIGMIQSAWEALSGWLSAKISSLASMASSAAAAIGIGANYKGTSNWQGGLTTVNEHGGELIILPNGNTIYPYNTVQEISHNAKGTSFFKGGWSEVNEHGGELMYLPTGTQIIPHATTVRILRQQIKERLNERNSKTAFQQTSNSNFYPPATPIQNAISTRRFTGPQENNRNIGTINNRSAGSNSFGGRFNSVTEIGDNYVDRYANATNLAESRYHRDVNAGFTGFFESRPFNVGQGKVESATSSFNRIGSENTRLDKLGNFIGAEIPEYNRITAEDSLIVKKAKQAAQLKAIQATKQASTVAERVNLNNDSSIVKKAKQAAQLKAIQATKQASTVAERVNLDNSSTVKKAKQAAQLKAIQATKQASTVAERVNLDDSSIVKKAKQAAQLKAIQATKQASTVAERVNLNNDSSTVKKAKQTTASSIMERVKHKALEKILGTAGNSGFFYSHTSFNPFEKQDSLVNIWSDNLNSMNSFGSEQLGELPAPQIPTTKNATTTDNSTSTQNSSSVNFNFGGVNISSGMNFDEFTHQLTMLFKQGAANSVF